MRILIISLLLTSLNLIACKNGDTTNEPLVMAKTGGRWGYIDSKGNWIISPRYDFNGNYSFDTNFSEGLAG